MAKKYVIRLMNEKEVSEIAIHWAAKEGWNPGLSDGRCFYAADKSGFFVGELDGVPISCISAVAYDENFGFMGFYIVQREYRGQGYGMELFNHAFAYMGKRNIGGDGVLERISDYQKVGFKPAYKNRRYQGTGFVSASPDKELKDISSVDFNALCAYDDAIFPAQRHDFLRCWITQPLAMGYAFIDAGKILGYGVIRPCFNGYKIAPLFADNAFVASKLFTALLALVPKDAQVFFDAPEANPKALELAGDFGMKVVFETMRIYTLRAPAVPLEKVFGVTSFELG